MMNKKPTRYPQDAIKGNEKNAEKEYRNGRDSIVSETTRYPGGTRKDLNMDVHTDLGVCIWREVPATGTELVVALSWHRKPPNGLIIIIGERGIIYRVYSGVYSVVSFTLRRIRAW